MHIKRVAAAAAAVAAAMLIAATPANAKSDGDQTNCSHLDDTLCLYYNSNDQGSHIGIYGAVYNYQFTNVCGSSGCTAYRFNTSGNGYGTAVKNNAASFYNEAGWVYWTFYNSGYGGTRDTADPNGYGTYYGNLNGTYNNNASQMANAETG